MFFARKLYTKKSFDTILLKLKQTNVKNSISASSFLNGRLVILLLLFMSFLLIPKFGVLIGLVVCILVNYLLVYCFLDIPILHRSYKISKEAMVFLEVFRLVNDDGSFLDTVLKCNEVLQSDFTESLVLALKESNNDNLEDNLLANLIRPNLVMIVLELLNGSDLDKLEKMLSFDIKAQYLANKKRRFVLILLCFVILLAICYFFMVKI